MKKKSEFKFYFDHPFSPVNTLDKQSYENFKSSYYDKWKKKSFIGDIVKIVKSKTVDEILEISKPYTKIDFFRPYFDVEPKQLQSRLVDAYKPSLPLLQQEMRLLFYRKLYRNF